MFHRLNIHTKLTLALSGAALAVFLVAGAALFVLEHLTLQQRARQILDPYAQLVSVGTEAAVRFEDPGRAEEILTTLRANPQILTAEIVLSNGRVLAGYSGNPGITHPLTPKPDGVYLHDDGAELIRSLTEDAHLYLFMSLDEINRQTRMLVLIAAAGLLGLLAAINLGLRVALQRSIVRPLSTLVETVEQVRTRADYHHRAPAIGTDEVSRLGRSFNEMMGAIEGQDRELRQLTLFQRTLLDSAAAGIISTTPDGTVSSFNAAAERLLGYAASEVVGKLTPARWHDSDELARRARQLSEELGETIQPGFEVFVARLRHNIAEEHEWIVLRKDGTRVPVILSTTALRGEHGRTTGYLSLVHDLTERKKYEATLQEKTDELDRYFTNTLDLLCIADFDGYFRRLNMAWETTLGYSIAELEGRRFLDLVHPDDLEASVQAVSQLKDKREVLNFANRYRSKDGGYRWLEWRAIPSGNRIFAVARDITERVHAEARIRQLNQDLERRVADRTAQLVSAVKELEAFSYSVSHDLRTPLRSIDGFSRVLLDDYADKLDADGQDSLNRIRAASQRMGHLIDDLLRLAQVTRNEMRLGPVDLSALAATAADTLRQAHPGRQIEFVITPGLLARGDARLLQLALENLLGNAVKFSAKQAVARIEFGRADYGGVPSFYIRDNGAGFDPTAAPKLFAAFQRFHTAAEFPGTGIGLATVQRIIHRHGGRITAESRPGQGATFTFTLPGPPEDTP
jgi:PAS domain S-box-containing protein